MVGYKERSHGQPGRYTEVMGNPDSHFIEKDNRPHGWKMEQPRGFNFFLALLSGDFYSFLCRFLLYFDTNTQNLYGMYEVGLIVVY